MATFVAPNKCVVSSGVPTRLVIFLSSKSFQRIMFAATHPPPPARPSQTNSLEPLPRRTPTVYEGSLRGKRVIL